MKILFLYQTEDYGIYGESKAMTLMAAPILKQYDMIPLSVGIIRPSERMPKIKRAIDHADIVTYGQGTFTFMRKWARESGIYGFKKNKPMFSIDSGGINEGWSVESVAGPSAFLYLKWAKRKGEIQIFNSSYVFDHFWLRKTSVPAQSVTYRMEGSQGVFDEFAPTFHWLDENGPKNFSAWVKRAQYLAGK